MSRITILLLCALMWAGSSNGYAQLTFTSSDAVVVDQGSSLLHELTVTGFEGEFVIVVESVLPSWLVFDKDSQNRYWLSGIPNQSDVGSHNVQFRVTDAVGSAMQLFSLTVNNVNDAPVIKGQVPLTTVEETPLTLTLSHFTITDEDGDTNFTLAVQSGTNYIVSGTTITPSVDFQGALTVPVTVSDGKA
ncbi:hypothetical protein LX69_02736, partial [Breznakibacter xylanolyticus]